MNDLVPTFLGLGLGFILGTIAHELGHAFFGWLAGMPLKEVRIGTGPVVASRRAGECRLVLRLVPLEGVTMHYPPVNYAWWRDVLFSAGGLLGNIALIVALAVVSEHQIAPAGWTNVISRIVMVQYIFVLLSLVPGSHSDITLLWRSLRTKQTDSRDEFIERLRPFDSAPALSAAASHIHFNTAEWRWNSPEALDESFGALRRELSRGRMSRAEEMLVLETLILDWFKGNRRASLDEIDLWSRRLLTLGPESLAVKGVRGAVDMALGDVAGARAALTFVVQHPETAPFHRMMAAGFLANTEYNDGRFDVARGWAGTAAKLGKEIDAGDYYLAWIASIVAAIAAAEKAAASPTAESK
jgi:Peptidase family M50